MVAIFVLLSLISTCSHHTRSALAESLGIQKHQGAPTCQQPSSGTVPPLRLLKISDHNEVSPGSLLSYQIIIQNPDPSLPCADPNNVFNQIGITDTLPINTIFQGTLTQTKGEAAFKSGNLITWQDSILGSETVTISYQVKVSELAPDGPMSSSAVLYEISNPITPSTSLQLTATNIVTVRSKWDVWLPLIARERSPLPQFANRDFEISPDLSWEKAANIRNPSTLVYCPSTPPLGYVIPHSGKCLAWLGGVNGEVSSISQILSIPIDYQSLQVQFWYFSDSADTCGSDSAKLLVNGTAKWTWELCNDKDTKVWKFETIDISDIQRNIPITFKFETSQDAAKNSHAFFDDIMLCTTDSSTGSSAAQCTALLR